MKPEIHSAQELPATEKNKSKSAATPLKKIDQALIQLIEESVTDIADETGWAFLGNLGNFILKKKTDFDPRNYGSPKLLHLIKSIDKFEIDERGVAGSNVKQIYLKIKKPLVPAGSKQGRRK